MTTSIRLRCDYDYVAFELDALDVFPKIRAEFIFPPFFHALIQRLVDPGGHGREDEARYFVVATAGRFDLDPEGTGRISAAETKRAIEPAPFHRFPLQRLER